MNPYENPSEYAPPPLAGSERGRRRLLPFAMLAAAILLTLGLGVFIGAALLNTAQAAGNTLTGANMMNYSLASTGTPGAQGGPQGQGHGGGQCVNLTVSSVSGSTITAKAADGSTVTIHTSSSTKYTKGGQTASASAVTLGSQIMVSGSHNSDGSINATQIDVR